MFTIVDKAVLSDSMLALTCLHNLLAKNQSTRILFETNNMKNTQMKQHKNDIGISTEKT